MMSMFRNLMLAATLTVVGGAAVAAPATERMSDGQFLQLNRCAGLVSAQQLGGGDGKAVEMLIRQQSRGRDPYIMQRADDLRDEASRTARGASGDYRTRLIAERDGVCQRLAPSSATTSMAHAPTPGASSSAN